MGELEEWIESKKKPVVAKGNQGKVRTNVNIRLDNLRFGMLEELSQQMEMTRSGLAEHIMERALMDTWVKWNERPLTPQDKLRLEAIRAQQPKPALPAIPQPVSNPFPSPLIVPSPLGGLGQPPATEPGMTGLLDIMEKMKKNQK
jgi:hypothetical protein